MTFVKGRTKKIIPSSVFEQAHCVNLNCLFCSHISICKNMSFRVFIVLKPVSAGLILGI